MASKTRTYVVVHNPKVPLQWPVGNFDLSFYEVRKNEVTYPGNAKYQVTRRRKRKHDVSEEYLMGIEVAPHEAVHAVCRSEIGSVTLFGSLDTQKAIKEDWETSRQYRKESRVPLPYRKPSGDANDLHFWLQRHVEEKHDPALRHAFRQLDRWLKDGFRPLPQVWSRRMRPEHRVKFYADLWGLGRLITDGTKEHVWQYVARDRADTAYHMGYLPIYYMLRSVAEGHFNDPVAAIEWYMFRINDQTLLDPYFGERGRPGWSDDEEKDR